MGLTSSLHIGALRPARVRRRRSRSTGNNLANIATEGYHRNDISGLAAVRSKEVQRGIFLGPGRADRRGRPGQVDEALEARLRACDL